MDARDQTNGVGEGEGAGGPFSLKMESEYGTKHSVAMGANREACLNNNRITNYVVGVRRVISDAS